MEKDRKDIKNREEREMRKILDNLYKNI